MPRGPVKATRENPFGLTMRQMDVLRHLAEGMSNAEIADRLFVSSRTVEAITCRPSSANWVPTHV